ncbi:MAG: hypothetical protein JO189_12820 [Deltaproteobacteria bacterium]|nr:hypothetical protein [Deltaproteobacteria bacterium]
MIFGRHRIFWVYAGCLPAVTASCALSATFCGLKWKRGFTGLTKRLQNNPITNNPAITNNDQPSFNRFSIPLLPQPEYPGGEPMAYVNIMLLLISFMLYHAGTAVKDFVEGCVVTLASVIKKNAGGLGTARNIDWGE